MNGNIAGSTARGGAVAMVGSPGLGSRAGMDRVSSSPVPQQGVGMVGMGAGGVNGGAGGGLLGVRQGANPGQGPGVSVHGLNGPAAMGNRLSSMSVNQLGGQLGNLNIQVCHLAHAVDTA